MASYVSSPSIQAAKSAPLSRIVSPICKYEVAALLAPAPHRGSIYAVWPKPSRSGAVVGGAKFVKVWVQVGRHALAGLPAQYSCTAVQLYSCTAVQLYSYCVQLYSCTYNT